MAANIQPPRGMRDFLPADKELRDGVMGAIKETFRSFGYREIETPVVEDLTRLTSGEGGENEKLIFKIQKRGLDPDVPILPGDAADLGLRYDLTLPLARFYATHRAELPAVWRAIQVAPVWRAERPQRGRFRQFTQCDIDVIGEPSELAEVELIVATLTAIDHLGISGVAVRLNDRRLLRGLLDACGVPARLHPEVLIVVDKLDKIDLAGVAGELAGIPGLPPDAAGALVGVLEKVAGGAGTQGAGTQGAATQGAGSSFDARLDGLPAEVEALAEGLRTIRDAVAAARPGAPLVADPTLVRGMGYYTGPIFELSHPSSSSSVGGGGRYDGMIGRLSGVDVAACGFSIGFERVIGLVDPARFRTPRRRVALVYDQGTAPAVIVAWQQRLIAAGNDVRLVRRARNMGRVLAGLEAEGFEAQASLGPTTPAPGVRTAELDLRPLEPGPPEPAR